jgi:aspartate/methionine/tyrosine aminotransferase
VTLLILPCLYCGIPAWPTVADFDNGGEGAIRICCAAHESVLEPAMERLAKFLERSG